MTNDEMLLLLEKLQGLIVDEYPVKYMVALQKAISFIVEHDDEGWEEVK